MQQCGQEPPSQGSTGTSVSPGARTERLLRDTGSVQTRVGRALSPPPPQEPAGWLSRLETICFHGEARACGLSTLHKENQAKHLLPPSPASTRKSLVGDHSVGSAVATTRLSQVNVWGSVRMPPQDASLESQGTRRGPALAVTSCPLPPWVSVCLQGIRSLPPVPSACWLCVPVLVRSSPGACALLGCLSSHRGRGDVGQRSRRRGPRACTFPCPELDPCPKSPYSWASESRTQSWSGKSL